MSHDLICAWLGLPAGAWPPDHYCLLGLTPGETNAELIEQRVHQRLDSVRRYQMMHPEQATEAMNRLAQAFVCLTEPAAKRVYDATVFGLSTPPPEPNPAAPAPPPEPGPEPEASEPLLESHDPLAWLYNPDALTGPAAPAADAAPPATLPAEAAPSGTAESGTAVAVPVPAVVAAAPVPPAEKVDPAVELARSPRARRGLGTKRALYFRVARTRELLRVWNELGKFMASPKRRLTRPAEATALIRLLTELDVLLEDFPPLLGEAGQPGYLVVMLAQQVIVPTFQTLNPSQREALSRDWLAGRTLLTAHRDFLRKELRALRRRGPRDRAMRALRAFVNDYPTGAVLASLAVLSLVVALCRYWFCR